MAGEKCAFEETFTFRSLSSRKFSFLQDRDTLELLMKWSMLGRLSAQCYSFDQNFYPYNSDNFVLCFFRDPNVASSLRKLEAQTWAPLDKPVVSVDVEVVPCTQVSMDLFDPLDSCSIERHDLHMLQDEDEDWSAIGEENSKEFLFRLFKHLYAGGELCQYENTFHPYLCTTKKIYKDLISVQKDPETKKISVVSTVLKVSAYDECGLCYPARREEEQTFAYMIIDPFKRHVTLFHHFYGIGSFTI